MMKIKRVYIPYWDWECWKNGMWKSVNKLDENNLFNEAITFTGDWKKYGDAMENVITKWPNTILHNLTNSSINKRAFLGHCACCYALQLPEIIVRKAWKGLTQLQRDNADEIAQLLVDDWINKNGYKINKISNEVKCNDFTKMNYLGKIKEYIRVWEARCYHNGIPDNAPIDIFDKVPSYKRICIAILKNDYPLKSLGFTPNKSVYYDLIKRNEL